jgi:hypothetical protein
LTSVERKMKVLGRDRAFQVICCLLVAWSVLDSIFKFGDSAPFLYAVASLCIIVLLGGKLVQGGFAALAPGLLLLMWAINASFRTDSASTAEHPTGWTFWWGITLTVSAIGYYNVIYRIEKCKFAPSMTAGAD